MSKTLSTQDWIKVDSFSRGFVDGDTVRWDAPWDITIPPLPPLDSTDPYAVKNYIMELIRRASEAGVNFTFFRLFLDDGITVAECRISVKIPDSTEIKGLQEWEIRRIAGNEDFDKRFVEGLMGASS